VPMLRFTTTRATATLFALAAVAATTHSAGAQAQPETKATVAVGSTAVGVGLTSAVTVDVRNVADLYGADVRLQFDPAVVEVVDADPRADGVQIQTGTFLDPGLVVRNVADNVKGTVWYALTQLNPSAPKSGQGRLFTVVFRGRKPGARSEIVVQSVTLPTRLGERIPVNAVNGAIRVVSPDQAPATPSPMTVIQATLVLPTGTQASVTRAPAGASTATGYAAAGDRGQPATILPPQLVTEPTGAKASPPATAVTAWTSPATASPAAAASPAPTDGDRPVAALPTWTLPALAPTAGLGESALAPSNSGHAGPWLWLIGLAVAIVLAYAVVRARRVRR
jgi:hypothetical protein